jgi:CheY-like chemotaxis protein
VRHGAADVAICGEAIQKDEGVSGEVAEYAKTLLQRLVREATFVITPQSAVPALPECSMISVLLVDPYDDSREAYATFLQALGFRVYATGNTDDVWELVSQADVLVTGLQVPGRFDGLGLIRCIRSQPATQTMPIVVVTARAEPSHEQAARTAGCDAFLTKPCLPVDLATEIRHAAMWRSGLTVMLRAKQDKRQRKPRRA